MARGNYLKGPVWRLAALGYAWTFGLLIGAVVMGIGTAYTIADIPFRVFTGKTRLSVGFTLWVKEWTTWQSRLHSYALTGSGRGWKPLPPSPTAS